MPIIAVNSSNVPKILSVDGSNYLLIRDNDLNTILDKLTFNEDNELHTTKSEDTYHHEAWTDAGGGTTQTIWTPAAGEKIHITHMCFSVDKACLVEIYDNASGTTIAIFDLPAKGSEHVGLGGDLVLTADNILGAKLTSGAGTTQIYFTAFGHEH